MQLSANVFSVRHGENVCTQFRHCEAWTLPPADETYSQRLSRVFRHQALSDDSDVVSRESSSWVVTKRLYGCLPSSYTVTWKRLRAHVKKFC